jgi:hypothetical protein
MRALAYLARDILNWIEEDFRRGEFRVRRSDPAFVASTKTVLISRHPLGSLQLIVGMRHRLETGRAMHEWQSI